MSQVKKVAVLVGSLRKESINRKIALALADLAPESIQLEIVDIGDLPLYSEDIDAGNPPAAYTAFREKIKAADAVLFVTPEYNRSVPAALKNALDVGSRPYGQSAWSGKPGAVVSASHWRHWRLWCQPPPSPVAGLFEYPLHAAAGSLHQ